VDPDQQRVHHLDARDGAALRAILEAHLAGKRQSVLAAFSGSAAAYD